MAEVGLDDVITEVDGIPVLDGVTFSAADGEFVGLIGPSGSGKTSTVRAIAGFDPVTNGAVRFDAEDVTERPVRERDISIVTQGNTLFPTQRVRRNLAFPLRSKGFGRNETRKRVEAESRANNIDHILDRWPSTLSGGEQRLAHIARSLVCRPRVFLMDEPLANIDPRTKRRLREELVTIQKGYGVTTIYVANRPEEIMNMPDRLVAIDQGRVVQTGSPIEVRQAPATLSIAHLTGLIGELDVTVERRPDGNRMFSLVAPGLRLTTTLDLETYVGQSLTLGVRSPEVRVDPDGTIDLTVGGVTYDGVAKLRELQSTAGTIATADHDLTEGKIISVHLARWHLFNAFGHLIGTGP